MRNVSDALRLAQEAQQHWCDEPPRSRFKIMGQLRSVLANKQQEFTAAIHRPNSSPAEKLSSEVFPLADAARFIAQKGRRILAPHTSSWLGGSWWMGRISLRRVREPWGRVLILAPSNYPLYLPGTQALQAIASGNAAIVKPAPRGDNCMDLLKDCLVKVGMPENLFQVLDCSIEAAQSAMDQGVEKVVLTGSVETGQSVLSKLAEKSPPARWN